jgi:hypothetical protein
MLRDRQARWTVLVLGTVCCSFVATGCLRSSNLRPATPIAERSLTGPSLPEEPAFPAPAPLQQPVRSSPGRLPDALPPRPNAAPASRNRPTEPQTGVIPTDGPEAAIESQSAATPSTGSGLPKPEAAATPLLDAEIQRVEALAQEQRNSLRSDGPPDRAAHPIEPPHTQPAPEPAQAKPPVCPPETAIATSVRNLLDAREPKAAAPTQLTSLAPPFELPPLEFGPFTADSRASQKLLPDQGTRQAVVPAKKRKMSKDETPGAPNVEKSARPSEAQERTRDHDHAVQPASEERPALEITDLRLCRTVSGFGSFQPWEESSVKAGQALLIYCEMTGLQYEARSDRFHSRLSTHIELRSDANGSVAWERSPGIPEDVCRRPRRDYYVNYLVGLPESLETGTYRLRLTQTDLIANRTASKEITLEITP